MANPPPSMVDHGNVSPSKRTENPMALTGTTYIKEDAFSDPSFIAVSRNIVVPNPSDPTEIRRKFTQNIRSNEKTERNPSQGTNGVAIIAEKIYSHKLKFNTWSSSFVFWDATVTPAQRNAAKMK
jgi:hypothetical protein